MLVQETENSQYFPRIQPNTLQNLPECSDRVFYVTVANADLEVWNIFWNPLISIYATN